MSSSKKIDHVKGLCGRCLLEFIDQIYSQSRNSRLYFRPSFVNSCPSNLLSVSTPAPLGGGGAVGGGVLSPVGDHILQEVTPLYLTRFRTYKIATPPQTKT